MFQRIIDNLNDGITRFLAGAKPDEAFEQAVLGEVANDYKAQKETPLITNTDFYELLKDIGLDFLATDVIPGEYKVYLLGEEDSPQQIKLTVQAHKKYPHAEIAIEGRTMEARIVIRRTEDKTQYQLDDAYIAEIIDGYVDPNWLINTDKNDIAPDTVNRFLETFSQFSKELCDAAYDNDPTEIEIRLFKKLKPLMDEIDEYGAQRYREYQEKVAEMGKPDPLAPR